MQTVRVLRAGLSPLKGTRHLALPSITLDAQGALGDRTYCLVDVAEAKVLRTVQHPTLTAVVASLTASDLSVTLPDGRTVSAAPTASGETLTCDYWGRPTTVQLLDGPHGALLSDHLGRPVTLARAPRRGVIYGAGVTIVTRASLAELSDRVGHPVDPARLRATLVIETDDPTPFAEEAWAGRDLTIDAVTLRIGEAIPRCAVIDIDPVTGERGTRLLSTLAGYRPLNGSGEPCFGVYAEVRTPGVIAVPDPSQGMP